MKEQCRPHIEPDIYRAVQAAAAEDGANVSFITTQALREWLDRRAIIKAAQAETAAKLDRTFRQSLGVA